MSLAVTLIMAVTCGFAHRLIAESEPVQQPGYLEFRIYTVVSNKMEAVADRFRETVEPVRQRLGIATLGYWSAPGTTNGGTFDHLMAGESPESIQRSIAGFHRDPEWVRVEEETERGGKLRSGVTSWKLTPTDFSRLK